MYRIQVQCQPWFAWLQSNETAATRLQGDSLVVCYLRDVRSALELRSLVRSFWAL